MAGLLIFFIWIVATSTKNLNPKLSLTSSYAYKYMFIAGSFLLHEVLLSCLKKSKRNFYIFPFTYGACTSTVCIYLLAASKGHHFVYLFRKTTLISSRSLSTFSFVGKVIWDLNFIMCTPYSNSLLYTSIIYYM